MNQRERESLTWGDNAEAPDTEDNHDSDQTDKENIEEERRGPGRPPKKVPVEQLEALKVKLKKLEEDNKKTRADMKILTANLSKTEEDLNAALADIVARDLTIREKTDEILEITHQLSEKTDENEELMKLLTSEKDNTNTSAPNISGILILDKTTQVIGNHVVKTVNWETICISICNIIKDKTLITKLKATDLVVFCSGYDEIINGASGLKLFDALKEVIELICNNTMTAAVLLPPILNRTQSVQSNLFNYRLSSYESGTR
jgi:hypothetical protein